MGRIRTIKPEFPQSESMGSCSRDARLCFVNMWTLSDDAGRLRGNSRMLASILFPYDDDAPGLIDGWLAELDREGCIERYEVAGSNYIQILNWLSHQKIDKPSASKIPPPEDGSRILANPRERSSLDQDQRTKDQEEDQRTTAQKRAAGDYTPEFDEAWGHLPRRPNDSKADAFKAWKARIKAGIEPAAMIDGAKRYAIFCRAEDTEGQYLKQGATFFGPGLHFDAAWTSAKTNGFAAKNAEAKRILGFKSQPPTQETFDA